jgi:hypothetical protein
MVKGKVLIVFILLIICSLNAGCTNTNKIKEIEGGSYFNYDNKQLYSDGVIEKEMIPSILRKKSNMSKGYIKVITDTLSDDYSYYYISNVVNASPIPNYLDMPVEIGVIYEIDESARRAIRVIYQYKKIGISYMNGIYFNGKKYGCTYNDFLDGFRTIPGLNISIYECIDNLKDEFPTAECEGSFYINVTVDIDEKIITDKKFVNLFYDEKGRGISRDKKVTLDHRHLTIKQYK